MYKSDSVPRRGRGSVVGTVLVWLVGALTLGGALFLWVGDHRAPDPGTLAEIAARTAPVGRVTLVESPVSAAQEPGGHTGAGGVDAPPADTPPAAPPDSALAPSVIEASSDQGSVVRESTDIEAVAETVAASPTAENPITDAVLAAGVEPETAEAVGGDPVAQTPPAGASAGVEAPAADSDAGASAGKRPAEGEPAVLDSGIGPAATIPRSGSRGTSSGPSRAAGSMPEQAAQRPFPFVPSDPRWYGPYRMVPIHRPDLPGAPYQLVPLLPGGP